MRIVRPVRINDARLVASSIPETDHPVWSMGTLYAQGAYVISLVTHTVYRSLTPQTEAAHNRDPDLEAAAYADPGIADPQPRRWQVIGATNRWKLFDDQPSEVATAEGSISVTLAPGAVVRAVGVHNVSATTLQVTVRDEHGVEVYARTVALQDETVASDWYEYYYTPIEELTEYVLTDLPPYQDGQITVTLSKPSGIVSCGEIVVGPVRELGINQIDEAAFEGLGFSLVNWDEYGKLTKVARPGTRLTTYGVIVAATRLLAIDRLLRELEQGETVLLLGSKDPRKAANLLGIIKGHRVAYKSTEWSLMIIQAQGVV